MFEFLKLKTLGIIVIILQVSILFSCSNSGSDTLFQSQARKPVKHGEYVVQKGDSLYSIAWRYKRDYRELGAINGIKPPYVIHEGQVIKLANYEDEIPSKSGYTGQTIVRQRSATAVRAPSKKATTKKKSYRSRQATNENRESYSSSTVKWQWPANGKVIQGFSSSSVGKKGIQISGNSGDTVKAAASGHVVYSGNSLVGYGNLVIVKHNDQYLTAYAHNRRVLVNEGDTVTQGQTIAEMGSSGTDRNKLHFEIRKNGKPVNPASYLPRR
jgi:lipoprotein NlpD